MNDTFTPTDLDDICHLASIRRSRAGRESQRASVDELATLLSVPDTRIEELAAEVRSHPRPAVIPELPPRPTQDVRRKATVAILSGVLSLFLLIVVAASMVTTQPEPTSPFTVVESPPRIPTSRIIVGTLPDGPPVSITVTDGTKNLIVPASVLRSQPLLTRAEAVRALTDRITEAYRLAERQGLHDPWTEYVGYDISGSSVSASSAANTLLDNTKYMNIVPGPFSSIGGRKTITLSYFDQPPYREVAASPDVSLREAMLPYYHGNFDQGTLVIQSGNRTFRCRLTTEDVRQIRAGETPQSLLATEKLVMARLKQLANGAPL